MKPCYAIVFKYTTVGRAYCNSFVTEYDICDFCILHVYTCMSKSAVCGCMLVMIE